MKVVLKLKLDNPTLGSSCDRRNEIRKKLIAPRHSP